MMNLNLNVGDGSSLKILCLGSHSDDIEIGCGGTLLRLIEKYPECTVHWCVFSAIGVRRTEAQLGAESFGGTRLKGPILKAFKDGFMPYAGGDIKAVFEQELKESSPD